MLRQRVLSALVFIPPALALLYLGGWWFTALVALFGGVAAWEAFAMLRRAGHRPLARLGTGLVVLLVVQAMAAPAASITLAVLTAVVLISLTVALFHRSEQPATDWAWTLAVVMYLGLLVRYGPLLRNRPEGLRWVLAALVTTWVTDSAAYFVGLGLGRHRLAPRLSPKKTWEGAIGGWVLGVLLATGYLPWLVPSLSRGQALVLAAAICTVAPFGDLAESLLKRQCGVKDSGHWIPGHGGALDRIDSLLFVFPVVYALARVWGG